MKLEAETPPPPIAWIALSDRARAEGVAQVLGDAAVEVRLHGHGAALLRDYRPRHPGALLLDVQLPDMGAEEVLDRLPAGTEAPTFCLHLERPCTAAVVQAMRRGAFDCVDAATGMQEVGRCLLSAIEEDEGKVLRDSQSGAFEDRLALLTPRQSEILQALLKGLTSKALAEELNLSKKTIDFHRSQILRRLGVHSLVEAAVLVCKREADPPPPARPIRLRSLRSLP